MSWAASATRSQISAAPRRPAPPHPCALNGSASLVLRRAAQTRKRLETYEIGYVHIDSCELRHAGGKPIMFLASIASRNSHMSSPATAQVSWKCHPSPGTSLQPLGRRFTRFRPTPARHLPIHQRTGLGRAVGFQVLTTSIASGARHRASIDQALPPLDQWTVRAHEPDDQGRDRQGFHYDLEGLKGHVLAFVAAYKPNASKLRIGRLRSKASVRPGPRTPTSSGSIRTTSLRDHTPSLRGTPENLRPRSPFS